MFNINRRFSFKDFTAADTTPPSVPANPSSTKKPKEKEYKPKTETQYDKGEEWIYEKHDKNPGGKYERVEGSPNTFKIKRKDKPERQVNPEEDDGRGKYREQKFKEREEYRNIQEKAQTEFDKYYGNIDSKEKEAAEQEAADQIMDFIKRASQGDTTVQFPDLPHDMKKKFIAAMFMMRKVKQIDEIKAPTGVLAKQKDMVIAKIEETAMQAIKEVTEHLSSKGQVERHVKPALDPESIFKPVKSNKNPDRMEDEEYADYMAEKNIKDIGIQAKRKNNMRGIDFNELPDNVKTNTVEVSNAAKEYKKNFGKFNNKELGGVVKVKSTGSKVGFVLQGYKEGDTSYTSNLSFDSGKISFAKFNPSMNAALKKLAANGFNGKIDIETDPQLLLMNKDNIRIICDDVKTAIAASEMIKEAFQEQDINVRSEMEKKQFGMSHAEQMKYMANLKKLAVHSTSNGKFNLPTKDLEKYMIAARLRGYDLVISGGLYRLRKHAAESPVGQIKLTNKSDPVAVKQELINATKAELAGNAKEQEQSPEIELDNPFSGIKKTMDEYAVDNDIEDESIPSSKEDEDPRLNRMLNRRDTNITEDTVDTETQEGPATNVAPEYKKPEINVGTYKNSIDSMDQRFSEGDQTIIPELTDVMDDMIKTLDDTTQVKAYGDSIKAQANRIVGTLSKNGQLTPEFANRLAIINRKIKEAKDSISAEKDAKINKPYIDKLDESENEFDTGSEEIKAGKEFLTNKEPDVSKISSIAKTYGVEDNSPALKELLGFKRLVYKGLEDEDRKQILKDGFLTFLSNKPSMKTALSDFTSRMNEKNYASQEEYEAEKRKIAKINPADFIKMLYGVSEK